jgi:hypothetical protein
MGKQQRNAFGGSWNTGRQRQIHMEGTLRVQNMLGGDIGSVELYQRQCRQHGTVLERTQMSWDGFRGHTGVSEDILGFLGPRIYTGQVSLL